MRTPAAAFWISRSRMINFLEFFKIVLRRKSLNSWCILDVVVGGSCNCVYVDVKTLMWIRGYTNISGLAPVFKFKFFCEQQISNFIKLQILSSTFLLLYYLSKTWIGTCPEEDAVLEGGTVQGSRSLLGLRKERRIVGSRSGAGTLSVLHIFSPVTGARQISLVFIWMVVT